MKRSTVSRSLVGLFCAASSAEAQFVESVKANPSTGALVAPTEAQFKSGNHLAIGVDVQAYNSALSAIATAGGVSFSSLTARPTTLAGYGITDALSPSKARGDLREAECWDDFRRADSIGTVGSFAPSGQTYVYLDQPTASLPSVVSGEMVNANTGSLSAYYLETQAASGAIRNIGCTGRFVAGPAPANNGYSQGVLLLTDVPSAFLPSNLVHVRWFFNQLVLEVSNSGVPGLRLVGTLAINSPINEVSTVQVTLEGAKCTVIAAGQTGVFYDSAFAETVWSVAVFEENGAGTGAEFDNWHFQSIWCNAPVSAVPGLTVQPRSAKLDAFAQGLGAMTNAAQTFLGDQSVGDGFTLNLFGSHGTPGSTLHGGLFFKSSDGSTNNWFGGSDVFANNDFAILHSSSAAGNPAIPIIYSRADLNQTTIGHNAATSPTLGYTLNVEGTLNAATITQGGNAVAATGANTWTGTQTVGEGYNVVAGYSGGDPGANAINTGIWWSGGGTYENWAAFSGIFGAGGVNGNDWGLFRSGAAGPVPGLGGSSNAGTLMLYVDAAHNRTTIGANGSSQPVATNTLNVAGSIGATGPVSCASLTVTGATGSVPSNTTAPVAWLDLSVGGNAYKVPLFQ